ncbi:MAG: S41 family peptidase [Bacteroidota bacterium]
MGKLISVIFGATILFACREESVTPAESKTQLDSIFMIASNFYFWNNYIPPANDFDFQTNNTPELVLSSFRAYSPDSVDKWSFAVKQSVWQKTISGISGDFGLGMRFLEPNDLRIAYVQPNSPAGIANLKRGYKVLKINGIYVKAENLQQLNQEFQLSSSLNLELIKNDSSILDITLQRSEYSVDPILHHEVFKNAVKTVAYLHLFTFSQEAAGRFPDIFNSFRTEGAEYLIVDLRYNGGGLLPVMEQLANHMVCPSAYNNIMYQVEYNDIYESSGAKYFFHEVSNSNCFKRIYFITAYKTASSSEVLISSLLPYSDVKVVGTPTHGKLMGMNTIPYADYTLVPVAFKILNRDGFHDDFKGIKPDIPMIDGVDSDWGTDEACIWEAIKDISGTQSENGRLANERYFQSQGNLIEDVQTWNGAFLR